MANRWLDMNGYRDPKALEALRAEYPEEYPQGDGDGGGGGGRECGYRKEGGTYAEVPLGRGGKSLEYFTVCTPVRIDPEEYGLKNVGVKLVELPEPCLTCGGSGEYKLANGKVHRNVSCKACGGLGLTPVTHVFDIVGRENYPNVADFLEEARRMGVSRRLELEETQYARLTDRSRLILLHSRAVIGNAEDFYSSLADLETQRLRRAGCTKDKPEHVIDSLNRDLGFYLYPKEFCSALWWHDVEGGEIIPERSEPGGEDNGRFIERKLASGTYRGYARPEGLKLEYSLGIFAVFPLVKLTVIDPEGNYQDRVDRASKAKVPVSIEDY